MTDEMKVMEVLNSEEAIELMAELAKLALKKSQPELADNEDAVLLAEIEVFKHYSSKTYPDGVDCRQAILTELRECIKDLKQQAAKPSEPERIPPRPYSYSHYLDPEEVQWLVKYDPEVKAAAKRAAINYRSANPLTCNNMSDEMVVDTLLNNLYKLNRQNPEVLERGLTPSFLKRYSEGTPEEIVIRFFDTFNPKKEDSRSKAELLEERKKNLIRGVIWLILFWPVGIYFLVKAHQIDNEILNL